MILQRIDRNVPTPNIYRGPATADDDDDEGEEDDGTEQVRESAIVWYGEEINGSGSATLMVDSRGHVTGSISDGQDSYMISNSVDEATNKSEHKFNTVAIGDLPAEMGGGGGDIEESPFGERRIQASSLRGALSQQATDHVNQRHLQTPEPVDVLVIYTQKVRQLTQGYEPMQNFIELAMLQTNTAFANSNSEVRVRLAATVEDTSYPDDGSLNTWNSFKTLNDGYFDDVLELREQHGADIVMLIANDMNGICGVAYVGGPIGAVARVCATMDGQYSFAHEVGHQFKALHDRTASGTSGTNRGYIDNAKCFRTIMSYNYCTCSPCPRILYYSNTRAQYRGSNTGTAIENNIVKMEQFAPRLAASVETKTGTINSGGPAFQLCTNDPCEENPVVVNDSYNGNGQAATLDTGNDSISRINTPQGYYIEVFEGTEFLGTRWVFGHKSQDKSFNLKSFAADNKVSSFVIHQVPSGGSVKLCKNMNCKNGAVKRGVGSYQKMPKKRVADSSLSRVILPPGWKIQIFTKRNFQGESTVFENPHASQSLSIKFRKEHRAWNKKTNSFIVSTI
jgi:hypothetical protein